mmetsp:Transcript_5203/g.9568  ORF Transcript_5203/g.9568 Transcript_5203/m.9568 type:complete len:122 (+) Transcript_5203:55-420(+)
MSFRILALAFVLAVLLSKNIVKQDNTILGSDGMFTDQNFGSSFTVYAWIKYISIPTGCAEVWTVVVNGSNSMSLCRGSTNNFKGCFGVQCTSVACGSSNFVWELVSVARKTSSLTVCRAVW